MPGVASVDEGEPRVMAHRHPHRAPALGLAGLAAVDLGGTKAPWPRPADAPTTSAGYEHSLSRRQVHEDQGIEVSIDDQRNAPTGIDGHTRRLGQ
jgi:hypothetical protein